MAGFRPRGNDLWVGVVVVVRDLCGPKHTLLGMSQRGWWICLGLVVVTFVGTVCFACIEHLRWDRARSNTVRCRSNLTLLWNAKQAYAADNSSTNGEVTIAKLKAMLPSHPLVCPMNGKYAIGAGTAFPTCTVTQHIHYFNWKTVGWESKVYRHSFRKGK